MRLTLRTLLAYLDNTLDPQDAEVLRAKLGESGFATQLVQRIRDTLANQTLPAPSPEAVGPVEEANVISEYLDSTLPAEQVAEIERACLESAPHLAEAAACHQILTMVLGKPAEVSPELRNRIYELPDRRIEEIAAASAGSFSAVAIPTPTPELQLLDEMPTADQSSLDSQPPVVPVGVSDSGVSDAPTRLRESGTVDDVKSGGEAIAGARARSVDESSLYGGTFRPSRITPWLVSLALAGVLLFALTRIFKPLLNGGGVAAVEQNGAVTELEVPSEEAPLMVDIPAPEGEIDDGSMEEIVPPAEDEMIELPSPDLPAPSTATTASSTPAMDAIRALENANNEAAGATGGESVAESVAPPPPMLEEVTEVPAPAEEMPAAVGKASSDEVVSDDLAPPVPPPAEKVVAANPAPKAVGKFTSDDVLLTAWIGNDWVALKKGVEISSGVKIVCAPTFRAQIVTPDKTQLTLIGPTQVQWVSDDDGEMVLQVDFGRLLLAATKPDTQTKLMLGEQPVTMHFDDAQSVAAASVTHFRAPGFDPLKPINRVPLSGVLSVQGNLTMDTTDKTETLTTRLQWVKRGTADSKLSEVDAPPAWIDEPDNADASLEASAREGLVELLKGDQPLEIGLREASLFRRSEVAALAAQSLLAIGLGDVYFSGNGILSETKQKAYWPDHFKALVATVDRSADSAQQLFDAIASMDATNSDGLFRLLTGFSQKQLVEGGDEELIEFLDSASMPARILALENLREITGTTLYFRPEQQNAIRRSKDLKKWETRQRKGDIRWKE
ncbi:MAG: hypothetical protein AB8B91_06475 [Rubripirellula sp.]